jgi:hypothetical protein
VKRVAKAAYRQTKTAKAKKVDGSAPQETSYGVSRAPRTSRPPSFGSCLVPREADLPNPDRQLICLDLGGRSFKSESIFSRTQSNSRLF